MRLVEFFSIIKDDAITEGKVERVAIPVRGWVIDAPVMEKYEEVITSKGHIPVMKNPSVAEITKAFRASKERELRGIIVGDDVYWWDSTHMYVFHDDVAATVDPNYPNWDRDGRMYLRHADQTSQHLVLDINAKRLQHPWVKKYLARSNTLFYWPGHGLVTAQEFALP